MSDSSIEMQIVEKLESWDQDTKDHVSKLERDVKTWNQVKETKKDLWKLRIETFMDRKGPNWKYIFYKLDTVNNYLGEVSGSISKIKDALFNDRKTIVMAVQIALYKAWYLPVWWIDWQRWPITRWAVAKFQRENWLWKQKNPWYLNVNTLKKLIEVSSKKETEKQKKNPETQKKNRSQRRQINVPTPDNRMIEKTDNTRVAKTPVIVGKNKVDLKGVVNQSKPEKIEEEKKWWTMEEVRLDITQKVWDFRPWHNWDSRFAFYNNDDNPSGDLPDHITICWEVYKYNWEWTDLNWLWFETYDGWRAFQLWTYTNGHIEEWFRFYFDWEREVGRFDYVWDLESGVRIDADWRQHRVENYQDVD